MLKKLLQLYVFWLCFFFVFRIFFLFYQQSAGNAVALSDYLNCSFHALRLDISASSYLIAVPLIFLIAFNFINSRIFAGAFRVYHYILIPFCILLLLANMPLYRSWGTLINRRAVTFIADPVEMLASLTTMTLISSLLVAGLLSLFFIKVFQQLHLPGKFPSQKISIRIAAAFISLAAVGMGIRGGWQLIPINESNASFSNKTLLNDAAVNPLWHLMNNISKSRLTDKNPYAEMPAVNAAALQESLYKGDNCPVQLLKNNRPNVIILVLESFTADVIAPLGGEANTTPFLTSLCNSSLLFTNIYAAGRRTDQALPSIFGGFPAQPDHSVMRFTEKASALPSLPAELAASGYHLSFYYGGETGFSNMGAYLHHNGFEKIISKDDFPSANMNSKWGAHDEFVLARQLQDLANEKQPFFSALLTLTSHEPFEIPHTNFFPVDNEPNRFRNAVRYTDESLKNYFDKVKLQPWFSNTLFILVADHGHILPKQRDYFDVLSHKIPLILYGAVLKDEFIGKKISATGSQQDIAVTLLKQLGLVSTDFHWSRDLTDTCMQHFAYIDLDESLGWITDSGSFTYHHHSKPERIYNITDTAQYQKAIAYRQQLYQTFLHLGEIKK
jgi:phosphoglycerol transferase MdoB-like AlkP superfamily enzyme